MLAKMPEFIDPVLLADRNASIEGELPVSSLDRLAVMLSNDDGKVAVKLFFGKVGKLATIEGHISTVLVVKCQRCLEAVEWPITSDFKLGVVSSMALADKMSDDYDPLILADEEKIPLKGIVEDELLLSLPDIPKHQHDCIAPKCSKNTPEQLLKAVVLPRENPFSILAELQTQKKLETQNGSTKK